MGAVPTQAGERRRGGTSSRRARSRRGRAARARRIPADSRRARHDERRARRARGEKNAPRRRPTTSSGFAAIPAAVGGIADSSLIVRMARSRAWIAVLATLLAGIVALNVFGLSLTSSISQTAAEADRVEKENALLRSEITDINARRGARAAQRAALAVTGSAVASTDPAVAEPAAATTLDPAAEGATPPTVPGEETALGADPPVTDAPAAEPADPNTGGSAAAAQPCPRARRKLITRAAAVSPTKERPISAPPSTDL